MIRVVLPRMTKLIDERLSKHVELLRRWSEINSGTFNTAGMAKMEDELVAAFSPLADRVERIDLPPAPWVDSAGNVVTAAVGQALRFTRRADAKKRVLLCIHYDTVFDSTHPFQTTELIDADTLRGPGVVDAKGGIIVIFLALQAFEATTEAEDLGWEVLLTPDEEIGSPSSASLLAEAAKQNHAGLVYEPAFADGNLVGARKGSGTYTAVVRGKAAHVGRDFDNGRSAIVALAELITTLSAGKRPGLIINCGKIEGGGAVNIVPDLAIGRFNVRADNPRDERFFKEILGGDVANIGVKHQVKIEVHGQFNSPPKPLNDRSAKLMDQILLAARELGLNLSHKPSGGTCDGNKLSAAGLPVVDSMGPVGGELHNDREYVRLSSLAERAKLTAIVLHHFATGQQVI